MTEPLTTDIVADLAEQIGPERDAILREMDERADREGFPTVGSAVGGWLALLARAVGAERIFEFGSGFGYSAYWFARALDPDDEIVLTEVDADELAAAREYLERGGVADRARFERGDAVEIAKQYDEPFDVVLIDIEKERYVEALDAIRGTLRPGSLVLADNAVTATVIDPEDVSGLLAGKDRADATESSRGIAAYLDAVRSDDAFETGLLPLGEGVAVSVRV